MQRPDVEKHQTGETIDVRRTALSTPLGELVRRRREELGMSQCELEAQLGGATCPGIVAQLERSRVIMPSWIRLLQLAAVLDLPVVELLPAASTSQDTPQPRDDSGTS
jgi:transcriptional regulator with XRE-family HTH domain